MNRIKTLAKTVHDGNKMLKVIKGIISVDIKVSRNEKCPCGSGLKFKNCCIK